MENEEGKMENEKGKKRMDSLHIQNQSLTSLTKGKLGDQLINSFHSSKHALG